MRGCINIPIVGGMEWEMRLAIYALTTLNHRPCMTTVRGQTPNGGGMLKVQLDQDGPMT